MQLEEHERHDEANHRERRRREKLYVLSLSFFRGDGHSLSEEQSATYIKKAVTKRRNRIARRMLVKSDRRLENIYMKGIQEALRCSRCQELCQRSSGGTDLGKKLGIPRGLHVLSRGPC